MEDPEKISKKAGHSHHQRQKYREVISKGLVRRGSDSLSHYKSFRTLKVSTKFVRGSR